MRFDFWHKKKNSKEIEFQKYLPMVFEYDRIQLRRAVHADACNRATLALADHGC